MENKKVVIFMYKYSVIVKGLERELSAWGYNVEVVAGKSYKLKELANETSLFVIYLPSSVVEDKALLENDWNVILIGEKQSRDAFIEANPHWEGFGWVNKTA
ncbi:MAG: hypothetical protein J6O04_06255 [Selenomonadaceae bacterium]|nr:hypothetical protein [Selenomonadaceae bacterium]